MKLSQNISSLQVQVPTRHEIFDGHEHIVVPAVILVEGVHAGSHGPKYYPADELAKYPGAWNGVSIPVFHPTEYGDVLSANDPEVIRRRVIGRVFNTFFEPDGAKLKAELWINIEKANKIAPEVLSLIRSGGRLELSTSFWSDDDEISGEWRGEEYSAVTRYIRPDHVAVLPGAEGACSWADGCGVRANAPGKGDDDMEVNIRDSARTPSFDGTESVSWGGVTTTFAAYRDAYYEAKGNRPDDVPSRVEDTPSAVKNWIASKTLLGEGSADNERDLIFFPVVNPKTNRLNEGALRAVISGRGSQARIPTAAKTSAQRKARSLLNTHFGADLEVDEAVNQNEKSQSKMRALLRTLGKALGLVVLDMSHDDLRAKLQRLLDGLDNPGWGHWVKEVYDDSVIYEARGNNPSETGQAAVQIKLYQRGYSVSENGDVELKDDAKEVREEKRYVPVENASAKDKNQNENQKSKEVDAMDKKERIDALIACDRTKLVEEDREWLDNLTENQLEKLESTPEKKETPPETPPDKPPETPPAKPAEDPNKGQPATNKAATVDEYIKAAPPEIQQVLSRSVRLNEKVKGQLVKALVENEHNEFSEDELKGKSIEELERLTKLARVPVEVDYSLQPGGPSSNVNANEAPDMPQVFDLEKKPAKVA